MNSGSWPGRHETSSSFSTCDTMAPLSLTAGETSALTKCRATLVWIFWFEASTRWKSSVQDQLLVCVHLEVAQQDLLGLAVDFQVQDRTVEGFFLQRVVQRVAIERDQLTGASAPP
jgi:hypothetical protein